MAMKYIFLFLLLSGCKAVERYKASAAFPADCAKAFPIKSDTVYRPGKPNTILGKVVDCDSVTAQYEAWWRARQEAVSNSPADTIWLDKIIPLKKVPCPPSTHRVDTSEITKESTAKLEACNRAKAEIEKALHKSEAKNEQLKAENEAEKTAKKKWRKRTYILLGLIIAAVAWNYRHRIIGFFAGFKK